MSIREVAERGAEGIDPFGMNAEPRRRLVAAVAQQQSEHACSASLSGNPDTDRPEP